MVKQKNILTVTAKGRRYYYHRPTGIRLPGEPGSDAFIGRLAELNSAMPNQRRRAASVTPPLVKSGLLYVVQAGARGPVKIGYSGNPKSFSARLASIQIGCAERLVTLAIGPGAMVDEKATHARLTKYRLSGEWFVFEGDVIAFTVELLRVGVLNRVALVVPNG